MGEKQFTPAIKTKANSKTVSGEGVCLKTWCVRHMMTSPEEDLFELATLISFLKV